MKNLAAKVRANSLWIEGRRYGYNDISRLPFADVSIEKAKTIEVDGGRGLGFQSSHSIMLNLAACTVKLDDLVFQSSEAVYQYLKARSCGTDKQIEGVLAKDDVHEVMFLGRDITETEDWRERKADVMIEVLLMKFSQNADLKYKLLKTGDKHLYEFTKDRYWGIGLTLTQASLLKESKGPGQNKMGELLMLVRQKLGEKQ